MSKNSSSSQGIGLLGIVFVVFLILKLTGAVNISWWVVFSPFFVWLGLVVLVLTIAYLVKSRMRP